MHLKEERRVVKYFCENLNTDNGREKKQLKPNLDQLRNDIGLKNKQLMKIIEDRQE